MERSKFWILIRTLLISYILTGILLLLLAFGLYKMRLGEKQVSLGVNAVYIITCLLSGFMAGKSVRQRRFFWGLLVGLLYFLVLFLASLAINRGIGGDTGQLLMVLGFCAAGGTIGGMLS